MDGIITNWDMFLKYILLTMIYYMFFQHFTSAESCMSAFKAPLDPSTALGGFSGNNYMEVVSFHLF